MKSSSTYRLLARLPMLIFCAVISFACSRQKELSETDPPLEVTAVDSATVQQAEAEKEPQRPEIYYRLDSIADQITLDSFHTRYTEEEKKIIFALNRMDAWRLDAGDKIIIPDSLVNNFLMYSPFPRELDILDSIPKAVLISQRVQGIALYEAGKLVRWGPISSGKKSTPTPNGLHYGNYKAKRKVSTVNKDWLLPYYFNFMNFEGVGVHQYAMPGYPASHACVRLLQEDAQFIYDWADQWALDEKEQVVLKNGTPFMVFGNYDFDADVPWLNLATDHRSNFLLPEELDTLRSYVERYYRDQRNFPPAEEEKKEIVLK